jgi:RNA polymerase sigma-70 factor (ECF subfamily)
VQRTVVQAWQNFSGFRGSDERQLRHWMKMILINSAKNHRRDTRPVGQEATQRLAELPDLGPGPEDQLIEKAIAERIHAALNAIDANDRALIRMRIWDDLTFAEIGRKLDTSEDAARMRFARALDRLRRQMRSVDAIG